MNTVSLIVSILWFASAFFTYSIYRRGTEQTTMYLGLTIAYVLFGLVNLFLAFRPYLH